METILQRRACILVIRKALRYLAALLFPCIANAWVLALKNDEAFVVVGIALFQRLAAFTVIPRLYAYVVGFADIQA